MKKQQLKVILAEIEQELRNLNLWNTKRPNEKAFRSKSPFFLDTMEFHQWLQYVLIERFNEIIESDQELPKKCAIFAYAFEVYKDSKAEKMKLLKVIHKFDKVFEEK